jgi:hypothetical protein
VRGFLLYGMFLFFVLAMIRAIKLHVNHGNADNDLAYWTWLNQSSMFAAVWAATWRAPK